MTCFVYTYKNTILTASKNGCRIRKLLRHKKPKHFIFRVEKFLYLKRTFPHPIRFLGKTFCFSYSYKTPNITSNITLNTTLHTTLKKNYKPTNYHKQLNPMGYF